MRVVDVVPKDIHYLLDFSGSDLSNIKTILDNMSFNMDPKDQSHVEANDYLHKVMYPLVAKLIEEVEDHGS